MFKKAQSALLLLIIILSFSCSKSPIKEFQIYRFIDHFKKENIRISPLLRSPEKIKLSEKFFPSTSSALHASNEKENPFSLKRKLQLESKDLNVIFAPPESIYNFDIKYPENSVFEFGSGVIWPENSTEPNEKKEVNFFITLEIKGRKKTIFQRHIKYQPGKNNQNFSIHSISMPHKSEQAKVSIITTGSKKNFPFWYNPVLYTKGQNRRNVILVSIDTLRADHLSCYGYQRKTTPHIDSLAADSALFLNTYATSPWTLPSHVSMLTSLFEINHQINQMDEKMDASFTTLADILREENFFCSAFTGGGFISSAYGFSNGFDSYSQITKGIYKKNSAETIGESVVNWIDLNDDKNFFLFVHTYQTHNPYTCPEPYNSMFLSNDSKWHEINILKHLGGKKGIFKPLSEEERRNIIDLYDAEIRYTDETLIHPMLKKLKELNLYDQTMIIITSDHGEEFYDHHGWEHGHSLYDELLKVPLIIKFPNSRFSGKKVNSMVRLVDIMPTILQELKIEPSQMKWDGLSLFSVLKGKENDHRTFIAEKGNNAIKSHIPQQLSMNSGKNKLILNKKFTDQYLEFFTVKPPLKKTIELYNLSHDPLETKNIADQKSEIANQIIRQINEMIHKTKKRKLTKPELNKKIENQLRDLGYIK
ncbi:MAG: sulfatase-like hydrolase/transferase [Candidatus Aminicenantaceae bacterium]